MVYKRNTDSDFWKKPRTDCNCGSFALNVTTWFTPYDNDMSVATDFMEHLRRSFN